MEEKKIQGITPEIYKFDDDERAIYMERGKHSLNIANRERIKNKKEWS